MRILLAAMLLTTGAFAVLFGCTPEMKDAIADMKEATPSVCKQYCREMIDCEWDADGDQEDNARDDRLEQCILDCGWYMANGTYVITVDEDGDWEYDGHISGSKVQSFFKCFWALELFDCEDDSYYWEITDEDDCDDYGKCIDKLGMGEWDYTSDDLEWDDDWEACYIDYDPEDGYSYPELGF